MDESLREIEVVLVGAGPIGLELAVVLQRMGVDYIHFEAGQIGQTITGYPRQARFFSSPERIAIAGIPLYTPDQTKATREQYLVYLRSVVQQFDLEIHSYERVTHIQRDPQNSRFLLRTERGGAEHAYVARYVVLAIGDMHHPRMLHIPGEDLPHVSHYFEDPHPFFRQKLLIVGGRNSAVEAALRCHRAGAHVTISYRRDAFDRAAIKYWLLPELESLIKYGKITFLPNTAPASIMRSHVTLMSIGNQRESMHIDVDFVLLLTGYVQDTTLFELAGVTLYGENQAPRVNPDTLETNVPGLFVAGTAVAGSQVQFRLFIENCHPHVAKIARAITGRDPDPALINPAAGEMRLPES